MASFNAASKLAAVKATTVSGFDPTINGASEPTTEAGNSHTLNTKLNVRSKEPVIAMCSRRRSNFVRPGPVSRLWFYR